MKNFKTKTAVLAISIALLFTSCGSMKPGSRSLHRAVRNAQEEIQYTHSTSANDDWMRPYRNWWNRPQQMTRIPFTKLYIP